ncbi:hypothetical protein M426DRAFT_326173 [Hypoxylon sp. CI-4A]|nr:hypothetical protein M426DRAFT_326173 [Hypoxylon sp. CI-4A]
MKIGILSLFQASFTVATSLPNPTGPFRVGVSKHTVEHLNTNDPLAPNNISTAFLATIYYPTRQEPSGEPEPYLDPEIAALLEKSWNYTTGVLASITSTIQKDAPFLQGSAGESPYPTILFGPGGGGPPVEANTILISELASYGYTVIGLDHPFEQPFIRYPNGTGVTGVDINYNDPEVIIDLYDTRLVDNTAFLSYFDKLVQKLQAPFNMTRIGSLGYSLGGAAAVGSMYDEPRLISGFNLDGTVYGRANSTSADEKKPVLFLASEGHTQDPTWEVFLGSQTGYVRQLLINGTSHHDFCDDSFWKTIEPTDPSTGPIDGNRLVKILNAYVKAFFDQTLLGQDSSLLNGPSAEWPEVVFRDV